MNDPQLSAAWLPIFRLLFWDLLVIDHSFVLTQDETSWPSETYKAPSPLAANLVLMGRKWPLSKNRSDTVSWRKFEREKMCEWR